jgi:hypothetical protein
MAILPFLVTAIWIVSRDIWTVMVTNRPKYLEREKLRKEWNKAASTELRRQAIVKSAMRDLIEKEGWSEEKWFLLLELVSEKDLCFRIYIILQR